MSRSMKGLKMVMSVRLCEGSMGTLTSETGERARSGLEDRVNGDEAAAFLNQLKCTEAVGHEYPAGRVKGRTSRSREVWTWVVLGEGLDPKETACFAEEQEFAPSKRAA